VSDFVPLSLQLKPLETKSHIGGAGQEGNEQKNGSRGSFVQDLIPGSKMF